MQSLILAAGLGTRLKPLTDSRPKALVEVGGKTLLEHQIVRLREHGFTRIVVNVHHFAQQVKDFLASNDFGVDIAISDETNLLLDTGGGILHAQHLLADEPFLVQNVDIFTSINPREMLEFHTNGNAMATLAVSKRLSSRALLFNPTMQLCGWRNSKTGEVKLPLGEVPNLTDYAFSGVHVVSPQFFKEVKLAGAFSVIDAYLQLCKEHTISGYLPQNGFVLDVGKPESLAKAEAFLAESGMKYS